MNFNTINQRAKQFLSWLQNCLSPSAIYKWAAHGTRTDWLIRASIFLMLTSLAVFTQQWIRSSSGHLEAIAAVLGNAIGLVGVIAAVLFTKELNQKEQDADRAIVKGACGLAVVINAARIQSCVDALKDYLKIKNTAAFTTLRGISNEINWTDLNALGIQLLKVDSSAITLLNFINFQTANVNEVFRKIDRECLSHGNAPEIVFNKYYTEYVLALANLANVAIALGMLSGQQIPERMHFLFSNDSKGLHAELADAQAAK